MASTTSTFFTGKSGSKEAKELIGVKWREYCEDFITPAGLKAAIEMAMIFKRPDTRFEFKDGDQLLIIPLNLKQESYARRAHINDENRVMHSIAKQVEHDVAKWEAEDKKAQEGKAEEDKAAKEEVNFKRGVSKLVGYYIDHYLSGNAASGRSRLVCEPYLDYCSTNRITIFDHGKIYFHTYLDRFISSALMLSTDISDKEHADKQWRTIEIINQATPLRDNLDSCDYREGHSLSTLIPFLEEQGRYLPPTNGIK